MTTQSGQRQRPVRPSLPPPTQRTRSGGTQPKSAGSSARARLAAEQRAARERRRRLIVVAVPLAVVLVAVAALVVVRLSGLAGKNGGSGGAAVITAVTSVPLGVLDEIGAGSGTITPPTAVSAPALTQDGKPRVLYVGAEYCPYCAAERWPMVVALSRFGTFTGLGQTTSSASDIYPSTSTLSFHGAGFASPTIAFTGVETETNQSVNGQYQPLDTLSADDEKLVTTYDAAPYVSATAAGSIPFVDIGGKYLISGASYPPQLLQGKTHQQIAAALSDPKSAIGQAVGGTANLITAAICATTTDAAANAHAPTNVCTAAGVQAAAAKLR